MKSLGIDYIAFCDDFGPMNASSVVTFAKALQSIIVSNSGKMNSFIVPALVSTKYNCKIMTATL